MDKPYLIHFPKTGALNLGYISIVENKSLPFEIQRVYWTYHTPHEVIRGHHAHKQLQQIIISVSGTINFHLENLLGEQFDFKLDRPEIGLYIPPFYWRTIQFSHSAVLICLASEPYEEGDYIRNYDDFKQFSLK